MMAIKLGAKRRWCCLSCRSVRHRSRKELLFLYRDYDFYNKISELSYLQKSRHGLDRSGVPSDAPWGGAFWGRSVGPTHDEQTSLWVRCLSSQLAPCWDVLCASIRLATRSDERCAPSGPGC